MSRSFRDEARARGWSTNGSAPTTTTHFLLDGGKLCVSDDQNGTFLNTYFVHAIIKKESLSVVELKTPHFRLFWDVDAHFPECNGSRATATLRTVAHVVWEFVTRDFFDLTSTDVSSTSSSSRDQRDRMLVCLSPSKRTADDDGKGRKYGAHLIFPDVVVNAPIAQACRLQLIQRLQTVFAEDDIDTVSIESTASSSAVQHIIPLNPWSDVIDDSVFKANGLRMIYSNKGKTETRAYQPSFWIDSSGTTTITTSNPTEIRELIKLSSIRCTSGEALTPCTGGEHFLADKVDQHATNGQTVGTSASIELYADALPTLRSVLPTRYRNVDFTAAFVTSHAVMLKTNSRFCQNKGGEHRTSTVYFSVTKNGISQRCYCRKDDRGCSTYASPIIALPDDVISVFFPGFIDENDHTRAVVRRSVKKRASADKPIHMRCGLFARRKR